ncbi:hypothetical protein N2152v2_005809 [Parachlorella kessleri]
MLHLKETVKTQPTIGSNVEQIKFENLTFEVWDLGGQASLRPSWSTYYPNTDAVIVVVDSTDRARVGICKQELFGLLGHEHLNKAVVLIFANKQDKRDAMTVAELSEALDLVSIKGNNWHIQSSCAITGEGLLDGLKWIAQAVKLKQQPSIS